MAEYAKVDILVFAPHPDDAELCCGGMLLKARAQRMAVGIVDITRGELGTRGTPEIRQRETAAATKILKPAVRVNLGFRDGHLHDNDELRTALVRALRRYRPNLLLIPHWEDQHPDHAAVGQAGLYAAWLSGAPKYDLQSGSGVAATHRLPYRPRHVLHYNNRYGIAADVVVDITTVMDQKLRLVSCYGTQFGPGRKGGPQTRLSSDHFFNFLRGLHSFYGYQAGVQYGEAYCSKSPLRLTDLRALV
jgi:bacillithiol biosynthesis deacetylase BshB1